MRFAGSADRPPDPEEPAEVHADDQPDGQFQGRDPLTVQLVFSLPVAALQEPAGHALMSCSPTISGG